MPEKSGFFDTTADDPREYPAREFAEYFAQFIANGVFSGGTKLKVTATGADANVMIDLGAAWINGYQYKVFDSPLVLPIVPATTQDRIDRIILRLDTSTPVRAIKAIVLQGLPSGTPSPPAIVRSGDIYDLSLAQVRVKANTTIILPENITDERLNNAVCGLVTGFIQQADTTLIFNQFQAWLNTKTAQYQQQWQDFMQSVQDEGFATTEYVDNRVLTGGYGVTTNSGNAYSVTPSPAPTALVAGLRVTVRINAANTAAATLNVNGLGAKSILKGNGNAVAAGNLKANSVYTFVYSGTAFILQGEGGEYGTAVASEVRSGKTIGTESGLVTGTFAVSASNYPKDISIFGVAGLLERMTTAEKQSFADQITAKGIPASVNDTNTVLAQKIGQIVTGKRFVIGSITTPSGSAGTVTGIPFAIRNIIVYKSPVHSIFGVYSLDAPSLVSVNTLNVGGLIDVSSTQSTFEIISGGFKFNFGLTIGYSASWGYIATD
ncbi:hypothetical protein ACE3MQ_19750 [Paenibacillus lentus]|uniref:hypothetical protein n=1 Tax=Paenibacillus lentus TaxID=1338368 RepID=UPI0036497C2B